MPDVLGFGARIGLLVAATNTVAEPELHHLAAGARGVTVHTSRIEVRDGSLHDDAAEATFDQQLRDGLRDASERLLATAPDYVLLAESGVSFSDSASFTRGLEEVLDVPVTTVADALARGLMALGVRRIGVVTPFQASGEQRCLDTLRERGFEVVASHSLRVPSAWELAEVGPRTLREALQRVDGPAVDALVQVSGSIASARLADELEQEQGKPVLVATTAIFWDALRRLGFGDQVIGFGRLLHQL